MLVSRPRDFVLNIEGPKALPSNYRQHVNMRENNSQHNTKQNSTHLHGLAVERVGDVLLDPGAEGDHVGLRVLGLGVAGGDPDLALLADADHAQDLGVSDRGDAVIIEIYCKQIVKKKGPCGQILTVGLENGIQSVVLIMLEEIPAINYTCTLTHTPESLLKMIYW